MPEDIFITYPAKVAFKTYQTRWQLGDIYISGNAKPTEDNPQGLGCYLVMTGRGCDDIFNILDSHNRTFGHMFHQCIRWFGTEFHFTRLDIAIDDRNEVPFSRQHRYGRNLKKRNLSPPVISITLTTANMIRTIWQGRLILVLENPPYLTASTIRTER